MTFACKGLPSLGKYFTIRLLAILQVMVLSINCHGYMVLSFIMSLDFLIIAITESGMAEIMS